MTKKGAPDHQKSQTDLERDFKDVFRAFASSCSAYDDGEEFEAPRLAQATFIFLVDQSRKNKSLLTLLARRDGVFDNTMPKPSLGVGLFGAPMTLTEYITATNEYTYKPLCNRGPKGIPRVGVLPIFTPGPEKPYLKFDAWWKMEVLQISDGPALSREQVVLYLRHKAGGGHVAEFIQDYEARLSKAGAVGLHFGKTEEVVPEYGAHYATMRQIAWELDCTLRRHCKDLVPAAK